MYEVMRVLRQQYQGSQPTLALENFMNKFEDLSRKAHGVNEKLNEIEELRSSLMTKHSVFCQILDVSKNKCLDDEDSCPHKLQNMVMVSNKSKLFSIMTHKYLIKRTNSIYIPARHTFERIRSL